MSLERAIVAETLAGWSPPENAVLLVHSAFRALSRRGALAEAVCEAFLDRLGGRGTLLMPTMTWRTVTPDRPVFDEMTTPSHTGALTEVFRGHYATSRSLHPTHSVAGAGPLASFLLSLHHEGTTPCAANSPYGLMRDWPATVLMLGVGLESCTAFHHAEEVVAPDLYLQPIEAAESYTLTDRHGERHAVRTRRHRRVRRDFPAFRSRLEEGGFLVAGQIEGVDWLRVSLAGLYQVVFAALIERRDATLSNDAGIALRRSPKPSP